MAPFEEKHHPSTLSDVGSNPVGPTGVDHRADAESALYRLDPSDFRVEFALGRDLHEWGQGTGVTRNQHNASEPH
jgi:hypothetical protein